MITLLQDQLHLMQDKVLLLEQCKENSYDQEHFTAEHASGQKYKITDIFHRDTLIGNTRVQTPLCAHYFNYVLTNF